MQAVRRSVPALIQNIFQSAAPADTVSTLTDPDNFQTYFHPSFYFIFILLFMICTDSFSFVKTSSYPYLSMCIKYKEQLNILIIEIQTAEAEYFNGTSNQLPAKMRKRYGKEKKQK